MTVLQKQTETRKKFLEELKMLFPNIQMDKRGLNAIVPLADGDCIGLSITGYSSQEELEKKWEPYYTFKMYGRE
jgi:hypothetical protein